jgi:hypothetical protein
MKNFKRILDKSGQYRYYVNGKRITSKKGASQFVKQNFAQLKPDQLSRQEQSSYRAKFAAEKGAAKASERAKNAFRFKGKYLDKSISKFLELITPGQRNLQKRYPDVKDYGQLLQRLQKDLQENLSNFTLDEASQYGLPNEKRDRTILENTADVIETLKNDFPGYKLRVITEGGEEINEYRKAISYLAQWERSKIQEAMDQDKKAAYTKFSYFPQINIVEKLLIIDLEEKDKESENRFSVETQYS